MPVDGWEGPEHADRSASRPSAIWPKLAIALGFLLLFLWELLNGVNDLVAWVQFAALSHGTLNAFAWSILTLGIVIPVGAYACAVLFARRRRPAMTALVLLVAYCASQAMSLSVLALFDSVIGTT